MGTERTIAQRLSSREYYRQEVLDALRGVRLPEHLGYPLIQICILHGILHSVSFAEGEAARLRGLSEHPEFTRALNARAIMSNQVPDMDPAARPQEVPYCIWYPEFASEDTYRQLARKHPEMRYQVARSCAVAGYTNLYLELEHLLPEVAVAEEAREAGNDIIFNHIMKQPSLYKIMDDYSRSVNLENPQLTRINGDTCVLSMIKRQKQQFRPPLDPEDESVFFLEDLGFDGMVCNITEDQGISELLPEPCLDSSHIDLMLDLLISPLPTHLPAGNKDLLILTAAFYGDIDRYVRLRRPKPLDDEMFCIVRGIYHNSLFALWWSHQCNPPEEQPFHMPNWRIIQRAITARHIMNNDISRVIECAKKNEHESLPYLIWYPELAKADTYKALAHKVPKMREACVRAAIYANYFELFNELLVLSGVTPNLYLLTEAKNSHNPHFLSALQSRADELGIKMDRSTLKSSSEPWKLVSVRAMSFLRRSNVLVKTPTSTLVFGDFLEQGAVYNGTRAQTDGLELFLMAPESLRPLEEETVELDYEKWSANF